MFTLIINPISGGGKALKALPLIEDILKSRSIVYEKIILGKQMDHEALSNVPCSEKDTVAVFGGDGTVFDVINCLNGHDLMLMHIPCGTGNDFIKSVGLPSDPVKAFTIQLDGMAKRVDMAKANDSYFINVCGAGFDVDVLNKLDMMRNHFTGLKAYLLAVMNSIKEYKPLCCTVSVDGKPAEEKHLALISIGNGRYIGGGMKAVPNADLNDGQFDVVEIEAVKKWQIFYLLPLFVFGLHTKLKQAKTYRCKTIEVKADDMKVQLDGEIKQMPSLRASIIPSGMRILL